MAEIVSRIRVIQPVSSRRRREVLAWAQAQLWTPTEAKAALGVP